MTQPTDAEMIEWLDRVDGDARRKIADGWSTHTIRLSLDDITMLRAIAARLRKTEEGR